VSPVEPLPRRKGLQFVHNSFVREYEHLDGDRPVQVRVRRDPDGDIEGSTGGDRAAASQHTGGRNDQPSMQALVSKSLVKPLR